MALLKPPVVDWIVALKRYMHATSQNVTLFEIQVFADTIRVGS